MAFQHRSLSPPLAAIIDDNGRIDDALHEWAQVCGFSPCVAWVDWWVWWRADNS